MRHKQRARSVRILWVAAAGLSAAVAIPTMTPKTAYAQSEADKQQALGAYKKGTIQYNLGKWEEAIRFFELAFETYPDPAFLFNIAQSHRQAGECKKSIFFYERYLALKPEATNLDEVKGFIAELETGCQAAPATDAPAPEEKELVSNTETTSAAPTTTLASEPIQRPSIPAETDANFLNVHASFGSSVLFAGTELDTPPQLSFALGAGYPIDLGALLLDAGVLTTYSPVGWETATASGTTTFTGVLANLGASKELASKISARGEIGAGLMLVTGLDDEQNVFSEDAMSADGLALSASFRVALGAELALSETLAVTAQPVIFTYSPAASGMRSSIDSVSTYQALIGLGLKL